MSRARWLRGEHDGRERPPDWRALAKRYGIAEDEARRLYEEARRRARTYREPRRHEEIIYLSLLEEAREAVARPAPGKVTRTMRHAADRAGTTRPRSNVSPLTGQPIAPGKRPLTAYLAQPKDQREEDRDAWERERLEALRAAFGRMGGSADVGPENARSRRVAVPHQESSAPPGTRSRSAEVERHVHAAWAIASGNFHELDAQDRVRFGLQAAPEQPAEPDEIDGVRPERNEPMPLPADTRARMEHAFGQRFDDVVVHPESPEVTGDMHALARGREIHFRAGAFAPGTARSDRILAHELAHIVQQSGAPSPATQAPGRAGRSAAALEADADQAAMQALLGQRAPVHLQASFGQAQAYRDAQPSEQIDEEQEEGATAGPQAEPPAADGAAPAPPAEGEASADAEPAAAEGAPEAAGQEDRATPQEPAAAEPAPAPGQTAERAAAPDTAASGGGMAGGGGAVASSAGAAPAAAALSAESPGAILASLRDAPALRALDTFGQAQAAGPQALAAQRTAAQEALPEIPTPTGLPPRGAPAPEARQPAAPQAPAARARGPAPAEGGHAPAQDEALVPEAPPAPAPAPTELAGRDDSAAEEGQEDPALARSAQRALGSVAAPVAQVPTRSGDTPQVDLSGEADPAQLVTEHDASQQETAAARSQAAIESRQDFGEHDIFPEADEEILAAQTQLSEPQLTAGTEAGGAGVLPAEALAAIDAEASPVLRERIGQEEARYAEGEQQYQADTEAAHEQARADMTALEEQTRAQQEEARAAAQGEVASAREDWQSEIDEVQADFQTKAGEARREHEQEIQTEQQAGNREATRHIAEAEQKAAAEKRKAETEVAREKEAASEESGGFWGWVKSKAKALVDGLKKAVNFIYDSLRKAVKALFEAAKRLALAAIELARKAIVGLIRAYGAILKGLVRIALAAFPEIRDRILGRIDQAVNAAVDLVNKAAEALKTGVTAILDFLASTIDKILGLIQDLYNAVFTVIGMIISGELAELMRRLGNLIDAAKTAPGQFETAAYEELLGGNLDEPLSPAELMAAGRTPPAGAAGPAPAGDVSAEAGQEELLPQPPWTADNVGVDAVASGEELSPELSEELLQMTGGSDGEVTFGESEDPDRSLESMLGLQGSGQAPAQGQDGAGPQAAGAQAAYDDGLTPRERAQVKWTAMKQGLANWWSQNWPYVLAGGVLGVAGFIVANILTGGAILAALPAIMTAVGYVFGGLMVVQLAGHLRDYLQKGWNGDIQGGGKSLAKGLAAGAIELITMLTFKVGSVAMKGAKAAAKGAVKGAQAAARGTVAAARGAMRIARRGAGYVLRGGKVLLRGVGQGIARGARRLRDLGARLLSRTRFKGFRIRIRNRRFRLEGKINPWILLADGTIKYDTKAHGGLGSKTRLDDVDGVVISKTRVRSPDPDVRIPGGRAETRMKDFLDAHPGAKEDLLALLKEGNIDAEQVINSLWKSLGDMDPRHVEDCLAELRRFRGSVDEQALAKAIADYRAKHGIEKRFVPDPDQPGKTSVEGGTVGAGKTDVHPSIDEPVHIGASPEALPPGGKANPRYGHPGRGDNWAHALDNHAEQTILGDVADKLDDFAKGKLPKEEVRGTVKMVVDQDVCSACKAGLDSGSAGIIKQFSSEFKNVKVIITSTFTEAGASSKQVLVVMDGKVVIG